MKIYKGYAIKKGPLGWFAKPVDEEAHFNEERYGFSPNMDRRAAVEAWVDEKEMMAFVEEMETLALLDENVGDFMRKGTQVKIPDVGPLATVIQGGRRMVKLELEGERFWIAKELVESVEELYA